MKQVELSPVRDRNEYYEPIEREIIKIFREEIYLPILDILKLPRNTIRNSIDDLIEAVLSGRITYYRGSFTGKFSSRISKELKRLGAKWEKDRFRIEAFKLPIEIKNAISMSKASFDRVIQRIDEKIAEVVPSKLTEQMKLSGKFDSAIFQVDKDLQHSMKNITVAPKLTEEQASLLSKQYTKSIELPIQDLAAKKTIELRKMIQEQAFKGRRYEELAKEIKKSYTSISHKAKFIARQETNLAITKFKEIRYTDAGISQYKWQTVQGSPNHPVRPMHKELGERSKRGELFDFNNPPIDDSNGSRHNPGENFNCFPGSTFIAIDRSIDKIFRRSYSGELTLLVSADGVVIESTSNHPILTNRGWIAAKDIQIGDYVFESIRENFFTKKMNGEYVESSFEQVFSALGLCSHVSVSRLPEAHFHGDVSEDKNVDIISIDRKLMLTRIAEFFEMLKEFYFKNANPLAFSSSSMPHNFIAWGLASHSIVSFLSELQTLLSCHIRHSDDISFRPVSSSHITDCQPSTDYTSRNSVLTSNSKLTHPVLIVLNSILINFGFIPNDSSGFNINSSSAEILTKNVGINFESNSQFLQGDIGRLIKPLRIIDKGTRSFHGHVYNLQTVNNWYLAQNRIVHNCRCIAIPIVKFTR